MNPSYRIGTTIVAATVALSAAVQVAWSALGPRPTTPRAAQDLGDDPYALGRFRLVERSGRAVTEADLADRVWIGAFIFTRCPSSCPRITAIMKGLQSQLDDSGVRLVSFSVDPEHDTPEVLSRYARGFGADADRWWFLTGKPDDVYHLILDRFHLGVAASSPSDRQAGAEAVSHSSRLVLVDRGNRVIGYFGSDEPDAIRDLLSRARARDEAGAPNWARRLPAVNASLNGTCSVLLLLGWCMIRARRVRGHVACMALAVLVATAFLACYLLYHIEIGGGVPFRGRGPIRPVYFTILLSHTVLAAAVLPLAGVTLWRALRRQFEKHARIARVAFPIWLYVSITGVVIYLMLYQMPNYHVS